MGKTQINCLITLSVCSTIVDFMVMNKTEIVFPRDRVVHIFISVLIADIFICFFRNIDFSKGIIGYISVAALICKMFYTMCAFIRYFHIFHGSNIVAVLIFTVISIMFSYKSDILRIGQIYGLFMLFNILLAVMIIVLGADKFNAANIYANDQKVIFSVSKLYMFLDFFALAVIIPKGKIRVYVQKKYLWVSAGFIIFTIVFQGLSVNGNVMYSISPLQGLFQIYSGNTIKRFDYYLAIIQTINYFAAVILYTEALKKTYVFRKADYE